MRNIILIISALITCISLTCNAQVKYIVLNISQPDFERCITSIKYIVLNISQPDIDRCITGIENTFSDCEFRIFPNPTKGIFTLEINSIQTDQEMDLCIIDISGKEIMNEKLFISEGFSMILDLSQNSKGMYIFIMRKNDEYFKANLTLY